MRSTIYAVIVGVLFYFIALLVSNFQMYGVWITSTTFTTISPFILILAIFVGGFIWFLFLVGGR